jgi:hypothetical protein
MRKKEAPGVRGARNELVCVLDMLRQGFIVYRNYSPHGAVDVVGIKRGQIVCVQIRSEVGRAGLRHNDVLAVVTADGLLRYRVRNRKTARLFEECKIARSVSPTNKKVRGKS